jgi:hypothetical protein
MEDIQTARDFLKSRVYITKDSDVDEDGDVHDSMFAVSEAMVRFAALHVQAALKEVSEKAETIHDGSLIAEICNMSGIPELQGITLNDLVYRPSILNAYPLSNIK